MRLAATALATLAAALPGGWPHSFQIGVTDGPGGARGVASLGMRFRYAYLAGGVNTGHGWATWNPGGAYASMYADESRRAHVIPVFSYYMLLQSEPAGGGSEAARDLSNIRDRATMRAYYRDFALLMRRLAGRGLVVVQVEPDLWGYLEQAGARRTAAGFAHRLIAIRDRLARNVRLAYHLSVWGTREDPIFTRPSLAHMRALGRRSAAFYRSLHARFDLAFEDVLDRDAGFYRVIGGDGGAHWWQPGDFTRHVAYLRAFHRATRLGLVEWQVPLGNTTLPDTWGRFRDDHVQWLLGPDGARHRREMRAAGVVAVLFGGGADGTTSAQTDGGLFYRLARAYERRPLPLR
ncbi:MAG TPA: hypothetical protein VFT42_05540 [Solirubrobacteraceae bacterium]|nr:hypothetical protein [Solirubrobacteraceae bacterium]